MTSTCISLILSFFLLHIVPFSTLFLFTSPFITPGHFFPFSVPSLHPPLFHPCVEFVGGVWIWTGEVHMYSTIFSKFAWCEIDVNANVCLLLYLSIVFITLVFFLLPISLSQSSLFLPLSNSSSTPLSDALYLQKQITLISFLIPHETFLQLYYFFLRMLPASSTSLN